MGDRRVEKRKQKKVVTATGLVANVMGKEERGKRNDFSGRQEFLNVSSSREEAEEFLCSMMGGTCELDPAVVKDVFG